MTMKKPPIALFVLAPFAIALFIFIGGWVVSWLWNALLPPLFGLPQVTFWQALGILALSRILFGGWSGSSARRSSKRHKSHHIGGPRGPFTPEERERIRQGLGLAGSQGAEAQEE